MSEPEKEAAPAKKGKSKLLMIGIAVIVLAGGGGAGAWWYMGKNAAHAEAEPPPTPGLVTLEPFLVNLADPGGRRFLRLSLRLLVKNEEEAKELTEKELLLVKTRSAILELLATQRSEALTTPEGKTELKKAIAEHAAEALGTEVNDVLFAEFVVQ
jgi:flagellar FliL protein